jgi:hypothetical protein
MRGDGRRSNREPESVVRRLPRKSTTDLPPALAKWKVSERQSVITADSLVEG